MRGSRKLLSEGDQLCQRFLLLFFSGWGLGGSKYHYKWAIIAVFFAGVPMMVQHWMLAWKLCDFQGIRTSFAEKPYIIVIFQVWGGGGGSGSPVPLVIRACGASKSGFRGSWKTYSETKLPIAFIKHSRFIIQSLYKTEKKTIRRLKLGNLLPS